MGLFDKFKKNKTTENNTPTERNEIANKELKETLANTALQMLTAGEDYEQLAFTECEFGYVFVIDGHGLEALFKITTDKGVFYFAAQKSSMMRLTINEELFRGTTETFLSMHS